ncbi:MAG: phosphatidylglycerophosphatase A [Acidobacteriia bacterium]|nr:phosphatidylglycerophosphatase A [Terriglobia bacterium]
MDSSKSVPSSDAANPNRSSATPDRSAGVSPAVAGASRPRAPLWATLVATFFGAGRLKPGPGTWGSVATVLLWALASSQIPAASRTWATALAAAAVIIIGIQAATLVARASGLKDPQFVVIDEVAGQLVTLIAVPLAWKTFLAGLILFRVFDILKPFPIRRLERLPEGTGIVVDDLGAGLYALAVMHLLLHFGLLMK